MTLITFCFSRDINVSVVFVSNISSKWLMRMCVPFSFCQTCGGQEEGDGQTDMELNYWATCVSYIIHNWDGVDRDRLTSYVLQSQVHRHLCVVVLPNVLVDLCYQFPTMQCFLVTSIGGYILSMVA